MKRRDIVVALIIVAAVAFVVNRSRDSGQNLQLGTTPTPSIEEKIENLFNIDIAEAAEKAELTDVSGGDSSGIATREVVDSVFRVSVLVDLPEPELGAVYQAWLVKEAEEAEVVSLGTLSSAKGGWILEYQSADDKSELSGVMVTREKNVDATPEEKVLEGSF